MAQSALERTGDQIAETARKASRQHLRWQTHSRTSRKQLAASQKHGGDAAEEYIDDTTKRLQRRPIETVVATFAIGITTGIVIGWMIKRR